MAHRLILIILLATLTGCATAKDKPIGSKDTMADKVKDELLGGVIY